MGLANVDMSDKVVVILTVTSLEFFWHLRLFESPASTINLEIIRLIYYCKDPIPNKPSYVLTGVSLAQEIDQGVL